MTESETEAAGAAARDVDWKERAREVAPVVAEAADRTEAERQVPDDVAAALHEAGLYRMLLPRSIGGGEAHPLAFTEVLEVIAAADGSTAWCLGQAVGSSVAAAFLDHEVAEEVFGGPGAAIAWGPPGATAKAVATDGGYRVTGRWRFASGAPNATWFGAHSVVHDDEDTPRRDARGRPVRRTMLFPVERTRVSDVWHVIGLRGTGSNDYEVEDLFVPEAYTTWRNSEPDRREEGPLYSIPLLTMYGIGFAGIALGLARATLDAFMELAREKTGSGMSTRLYENAVIQSEVAQAEAKLGASRAYLVEMVEETWATACAGAPFPLDQRARLRIAITWAMNQAREVADFAYRAAGTNAIPESGPFERRLRDMFTVSQQGQAHRVNFEFAGQALFGLEPGHRV